MNDIYQQLDNQSERKVKPRTNDGFLDASLEEKVEQAESLSDSGGEISSAKEPEFVIETSKSKLLTLETSIRQEIDLMLYEHPEISWDTIIEAALINSLSSQSSKKRLVKLAAERLTARKKSAVYKRSKTMAQKYT